MKSAHAILDSLRYTGESHPTREYRTLILGETDCRTLLAYIAELEAVAAPLRGPMAGDTAAAVTRILGERHRQVAQEDYTPSHDDEHTSGSLADAAACYALSASGMPEEMFHLFWPWEAAAWKPSPGDPLRSLTKAGALILAEMGRLQRAARTLIPPAQLAAYPETPAALEMEVL